MTASEARERQRDAEKRYEENEASYRELYERRKRLDNEREFWTRLAEALFLAEAGTYPDPIPY